MFRHRAPDGGKHACEVEAVGDAERRGARRGELEHHEARAGPKHAVRFAQPRVQVGEVPHPERDHRAVEATVRKRQHERVSGDGAGARSLVPPSLEHRHNEIRADHAS